MLNDRRIFMQDDEIIRVANHQRLPGLHTPTLAGEGCADRSFEAMQGDVGEQRTQCATLWRTRVGGEELVPLQDTRFEPSSDGAPQGREGVEFPQQRRLVERSKHAAISASSTYFAF